LQFTTHSFDDTMVMLQDGTHVVKEVADIKKISSEDSGNAQGEQPINAMDRTVIYHRNIMKDWCCFS
jgi:hypothetical protein